MLSQALLRNHPTRYRYFQTASFSWRNVYARNHNSLLGRIEGVDGIKTGYTRASGFNLASSAQRNGHRIFAVVLGGESAATRDAQMAHLIDIAFASIEARATGRPPAPSAVYTSLPAANRIGGALPATTPSGEVEDMGAIPVTAAGAAIVEQGSTDGQSYVTPFAAPARAPVQIRGASAPDAAPTANDLGASPQSSSR
jgi:D-alanyl-D-alanine carboxypeptidase